MDVDMQLGYGHAAWSWERSMERSMQHGEGNAAWMYMQQGCGHAAWTGAYSIDMGMQHGHGRAAYMGMLRGQGHATSWIGACGMDMDMQHEHGHGHRLLLDRQGQRTILFSKFLVEKLEVMSESKRKYLQKLAEVLAKVIGSYRNV
jgi:hypothetical protein